jgi:hypothetical protein
MTRTAQLAPIGGHRMTAKKKSCHRCGRRLRRLAYEDSMAQLRAGRVDHLVCTNCQTPADLAEMFKNENTREVAIAPDGTYLTRPRKVV